MPPKAKSKATPATSDDDQEEYISLSIVKELMAQQESAFKSMIESLIGATTQRVNSWLKK